MDASVIWQQGMIFTGTTNSGFSVPLDALPEAGGVQGGFDPLGLMVVSLGGCTAMDVISILQKKKQDVKDFQVKVHAERADEHPKVFTRATIEYLVTGKNVDAAAVLRAIGLSAEQYCPAQAMLSKAFPMNMVYKIFDEDGKLVNEGEYKKS